MRSTFKILFYANKGKEKDGIVPIMGRITINGTQCQFSCKHSMIVLQGSSAYLQAVGHFHV